MCYHAIADLDHDPTLRKFGVPAEVFRRQLGELRRAGYHFLHPDGFLHFLDAETEPPPRSLLITFDDCYVDLAEAALPVLQEFGAPAVAFAVTRRLGGSNDWDHQRASTRLSLLGAAELQEVAAGGVEIGSHSRTHAELRRLGDNEVLQEIRGSRADLIEAGLPAPRFFAYPHGSQDGRMYPMLERAGYAAAFAVEPGLATPAANRWAIPRVTVTPDDVGWRLRAKLSVATMRRAVAAIQWLRGAASRRAGGTG